MKIHNTLVMCGFCPAMVPQRRSALLDVNLAPDVHAVAGAEAAQAASMQHAAARMRRRMVTEHARSDLVDSYRVNSDERGDYWPKVRL